MNGGLINPITEIIGTTRREHTDEPGSLCAAIVAHLAIVRDGSGNSLAAAERHPPRTVPDEPRQFVGVDVVPDEIARWCGGSA
jgi:hypothetical protein